MMMKRTAIFLLVLSLMALSLAACAGGGKDPAALAVESYLTALAGQDVDRLANLACKDWESQARMELDAFQGVKATVDGLACKQERIENGAALVTCEGKIVATYNNEQQDLPVSGRTYQVVEEGGEWRVCGYR